MANMRIKFDGKKLERDLNKQLKKQLDQIVASEIVQASLTEDGGMILLNRMGEDALKAILGIYDGNEEYAVSGSFDIFPVYMRLSHKQVFESLKYAGLVASYQMYIGNNWTAYLTPEATEYFTKKETISERANPMFTKLFPSTRALLSELVNSANPGELLRSKLENCDDKEESILRSQIGELEKGGYASVNWSANTVYKFSLTGMARRYDELEASFTQKSTAETVYNINATQANIASDNATINAVQNNNGLDMDQLKRLIAAVREAMPNDMPQSDVETVNDNLEVIDEQLSQPSPKKGFLRTAITGLNAIKSTVEFGAATATLIQFAQAVISAL